MVDPSRLASAGSQCPLADGVLRSTSVRAARALRLVREAYSEQNFTNVTSACLPTGATRRRDTQGERTSTRAIYRGVRGGMPSDWGR